VVVAATVAFAVVSVVVVASVPCFAVVAAVRGACDFSFCRGVDRVRLGDGTSARWRRLPRLHHPWEVVAVASPPSVGQSGSTKRARSGRCCCCCCCCWNGHRDCWTSIVVVVVAVRPASLAKTNRRG